MSKNKCENISFTYRAEHFHLYHKMDLVTNKKDDFLLHLHPHHEVYIYIRGKAEFTIEGTKFRLNPYDILIVPPYTLHQAQPLEGDFFERYVINIFPSFFVQMNCPQYENVFFNINNFQYKIPGHIVKHTNIITLLEFLNYKSPKTSEYIHPFLYSKIIDLLYYINTIDNFEKCFSVNETVQEIIEYIDNNFVNLSKLDNVTDHFFYSKNYLNQMFKKNTGMTIIRYLNFKKIENVEKLYKHGYSFTHACIESGFNSYASFAYIYKKEFGISPKKSDFYTHHIPYN